jgi:hypothetical protein
VGGDERSVSATEVATLRAGALRAVPGGAVYRIESGAYEAHMRKSNGALVSVKFDNSLHVTKVEAGMGSGDPRPQH